MAFDRSNLRRGKEAIEKVNEERGNGGEFKPFLPSIYWPEDQSKHYLLFLNPIEEIPTVLFHNYVELDDGKPHQIMARTEPSIGEAVDPIERDWKYKPRQTSIAIAVELDVTTQMVGKREKPVGFEVKTVEFERRIRDDKGELTDEREAVVAPRVGFITQSPHNFSNALSSFDANEAPIERTPLKITRVGAKTNTTYSVVGYEDLPIDLSGLLENIEFVSYLGGKAEELLAELAEAEQEEADDFTLAGLIGETLLDLKLEELADEDNYNELYHAITKPSRYGDKEDKKSDSKPARPARTSQRRGRNTAVQSGADNADEPEEQPVARSREPEEEVTRTAPAQARLRKLREQNAAAAK